MSYRPFVARLLPTNVCRAVTRELPNNVPYSVKISFINDFQRSWKERVHKCAASVHNIVQGHMTQLIHAIFGPYIHLEPKIRSAGNSKIYLSVSLTINDSYIVNQLIEDMYRQGNGVLGWALKFEESSWTQNEHYLSASKETFLTKYKAIRAKAKAGTSVPSTLFKFSAATSRASNAGPAGGSAQPVSRSPPRSLSQPSPPVSPWSEFRRCIM